MSEKIEVLKAIVAAWCERQDIDAVLAHLTEDVVWHHSAITAPPKIGKDGARAFLTMYKDKVANPRWRIFQIAETADALYVEGVDEFDTDAGRAVIPYMGVLEFRDNRICGWRDYFDRGVADRSAAGEGLPDYALPLVERPALPGLGG